MLFYNYIYASFIRILEGLNNRDPRFTAVVLLAATQFLHVSLLIGLVEYFTGIKIIPNLSSKYYLLFVTLPWLLIFIWYYSKRRTERILNLYNIQSDKKKKNWKIVAVLAIIIPIMLFPILFAKPR